MSAAIEQVELIKVTGPSVRRYESEQVVGTPWAFIRAVEKKFGTLSIDLAATHENAKAPRYITPQDDTFTQNWAKLLDGGLGWLNPEFDPMNVWVEKCAAEQRRGATLLALMPASVSTNWFWNYVQPFATIITLTPRIAFIGSHKLFKKGHAREGQRVCDPSCEGCQPYPKDLMLAHYCENPNRELQRWRWKA